MIKKEKILNFKNNLKSQNVYTEKEVSIFNELCYDWKVNSLAGKSTFNKFVANLEKTVYDYDFDVKILTSEEYQRNIDNYWGYNKHTSIYNKVLLLSKPYRGIFDTGNILNCSVDTYLKNHYTTKNSLLYFCNMNTYYCPKCNNLKHFSGIHPKTLNCCGIDNVVINISTKVNDMTIKNKVEELNQKLHSNKIKKAGMTVDDIYQIGNVQFYQVSRHTNLKSMKNGFNITCNRKKIMECNEKLEKSQVFYINDNKVICVKKPDDSVFDSLKTEYELTNEQEFVLLELLNLFPDEDLLKTEDLYYNNKDFFKKMIEAITDNLNIGQIIEYLIFDTYNDNSDKYLLFKKMTNNVFVFDTQQPATEMFINEFYRNIFFQMLLEYNNQITNKTVEGLVKMFKGVSINHRVTYDNAKIINYYISRHLFIQSKTKEDFHLGKVTKRRGRFHLYYMFKIHRFWDGLGEHAYHSAIMKNSFINKYNDFVTNDYKDNKCKELNIKDLNWMINHNLIPYIVIVNEGELIKYYSLIPKDFLQKIIDTSTMTLPSTITLDALDYSSKNVYKSNTVTNYCGSQQYFQTEYCEILDVHSRYSDYSIQLYQTFTIFNKLSENQLMLLLHLSSSEISQLPEMLLNIQCQQELDNIFKAIKKVYFNTLPIKFLKDFERLKSECEELFPELVGRQVNYDRIVMEHDYYMQRRREGTVDMTSIFNDRYIKFKPFNMVVNYKKYIVEAPREVKDLIHEGVTQNHCMDSYGKNIEAGQEMVLFVRLKRGEPLYAVSLDINGNVIQSSGEAHSAVPGEVLAQIQREFANDKAKLESLQHFFNCRK